MRKVTVNRFSRMLSMEALECRRLLATQAAGPAALAIEDRYAEMLFDLNTNRVASEQFVYTQDWAYVTGFSEEGAFGLFRFQPQGSPEEVRAELVEHLPYNWPESPQTLGATDSHIYLIKTDELGHRGLWAHSVETWNGQRLLDVGDETSSFRIIQATSSDLFAVHAVSIGQGSSRLWRIHSQSQPTAPIYTIGTDWFTDADFSYTAVVGDTLYFMGPDDQGYQALFRAGPQDPQAVRIRSFSAQANSSWNPDLRSDGGLLFFSAYGDDGWDRWISDGTAEETHAISELAVAEDLSAIGRPVVFGGAVYFGASNALGGELWSLENEGDGGYRVELVTDLNPGAGSSWPNTLTVTEDGLYFVADAGQGRALWRITDRLAPAQLIADVITDDSARAFVSLDPLIRFGSKLVFATANRVAYLGGRVGAPYTWWITDGSEQGATELARSVLEGSRIDSVHLAGDRLVFWARHRAGGWRVWTSDGTEKGTQPIESMVGATYGSTQTNIDTMGKTRLYNNLWTPTPAGLFFAPYEGPSNDEGFGIIWSRLWITDGTRRGSKRLDTLGGESKAYRIHTPVWSGEKLYFIANGRHFGGSGVFTSDGTFDGTQVRYVGLNGEPGEWAIRAEHVFDGQLFLLIRETLWRSDGTKEGTYPIVLQDYGWDFYDSFSPGRFAAMDDGLLTWNCDSSWPLSCTLLLLDGTPDGILPVADLPTPKDPRETFGNLTRWGDLVLFSASGELWRTDATSEGTYKLLDIPGLVSFIHPTEDSAYVFTRIDDSTLELWITDGSADGTRSLGTFPWSGREPILHAISWGQRLLFFVTRPGDGVDVWSADDSQEGLQHLLFLSEATEVSHFLETENGVHFLSHQPGGGPRWWFTDGTAAGTRQIRVLVDGNRPLEIDEITRIDGRIIATLRHPVYGSEPFIVLPEKPRSADLDLNGTVDSADLTELLLGWTGERTPHSAGRFADQGDTDGDQDVDAADLTTLLTEWTGSAFANAVDHAFASSTGSVQSETITSRFLA